VQFVASPHIAMMLGLTHYSVTIVHWNRSQVFLILWFYIRLSLVNGTFWSKPHILRWNHWKNGCLSTALI